MLTLKTIKDLLINNKNNSDNNKPKVYIKSDLHTNIDYIRNTLNNASDLIVREFNIKEYRCAICLIDGLTKGDYAHDLLLKNLLVDIWTTDKIREIHSVDELFDALQSQFIALLDISVVSDFDELIINLLSGDCVLLVDGIAKSITIETKGWIDRGIVESSSQTLVRGPKDSFNETLRTNTMLIRRRIKDKRLRVESRKIGRISKTEVAIMYMEGIANDRIVQEVHRRLDRIDIDGIIDSSYIEQMIQDHPYSLFPTVHNTERPDTVASSIMCGYVAIVVDNSPFVLLVPGLFVTFTQAAEDYYHNFYYVTFIRLVRFVSLFLALLTPGVYIAITTFHQEMLPTSLLISISNQREGVPFPVFLEALIMELTFEILREAGIRMPRAIGSAMSIVGALILGEAAVNAGIVSSFTVIIVSLTAICSLIIPSYHISISIRVTRFIFMVLGATFGLFGIISGLVVLGLYLSSMRSFGVPYLFPFAPLNFEALKDSVIRFPLWKVNQRPKLISDNNETRQSSDRKNNYMGGKT